MKRLKRKTALIIFLSLVALLLCGATVYAEESAEEKLEDEVEDKLGELDFSDLESWLDEYGDIDGISENGILQTVKDVIGGKYDLNTQGFLSAAADMASGAVSAALPSLIAIFALALLYSIVGGFSGGFLKKSTTEILYFACYAAMISVVVA